MKSMVYLPGLASSDGDQEGYTDGIAAITPAGRDVLGDLLLALESVPGVTALLAGSIVELRQLVADNHFVLTVYLAAVTVIYPVLGKLLVSALGNGHLPSAGYAYAGIGPVGHKVLGV